MNIGGSHWDSLLLGRCWEVIHSEVIHSECRYWGVTFGFFTIGSMLGGHSLRMSIVGGGSPGDGGLPGDGCLPGDGGLPADGGVSLVFFTIGSISGGKGGVVIDFQVNPGHVRSRIPECVPKR